MATLQWYVNGDTREIEPILGRIWLLVPEKLHTDAPHLLLLLLLFVVVEGVDTLTADHTQAPVKEAKIAKV